GVEAEVGFVEEGQRCSGGEADDDSYCGELTAGELLDSPIGRKSEVADEGVREVGVPVSEEPRGAREHVLDLEVIRVLLALLDERDVLEHARVLDGAVPEDLDGSPGREVLARDELHECGLAGAVAPEETIDAPLLDGEAHVVDGTYFSEVPGEPADFYCGGHVAFSFRIMVMSWA